LTQIDDNIENFAARHPDKLALSLFTNLIVQTSEDMPPRAAVVVLNEITFDPRHRKGLSVPSL
jgi:hypothetical protein